MEGSESSHANGQQVSTGPPPGGPIPRQMGLPHSPVFFQFTKGLEGLEVAPVAQESMESLEHTLAATSGREAGDYMRSITK